VGTVSGLEVYRFSSAGRIAGICLRICGRAYVIGMCQRGIFWRFGATIYDQGRGYQEAIFGVRTKLGEIDLMLKTGIKDEMLPLRIRPNRFRGSVHVSRTGIVSFVLGSTAASVFTETDRKNSQIFSASEAEDASYYQSDHEERY
jgi:hypothetical protein